MTNWEPIDRARLRARPLPVHAPGTDKNDRGGVFIVGGSVLVPGALRLTAEAAFRVGAGKVRIATVASAALALGMAMPEAAVIALPEDEDGEIAREAAQILNNDVARCGTLVLGPAMSDSDQIVPLVASLLREPRPDLSIVLDAAAVSCASELAEVVGRHQGRVILTPHHGEMARLKNCSTTAVENDAEEIAQDIVAQFNAVVVLKSDETFIATASSSLDRYASDCVGLATGGSGDVLAGRDWRSAFARYCPPDGGWVGRVAPWRSRARTVVENRRDRLSGA